MTMIDARSIALALQPVVTMIFFLVVLCVMGAMAQGDNMDQDPQGSYSNSFPRYDYDRRQPQPAYQDYQDEGATRKREASSGGSGLGTYNHGYAVQDSDTGNDFNVQENSDGNTISGQYSVLLPDGRVQTVKYSVTPSSGYVAEVSYS